MSANWRSQSKGRSRFADGRSTLLDRARWCVDEIPGEERRFAEVHAVKALIHTWLAWQDGPGTPLGLAIAKRYFEPEGPHVHQLLAWLTRLFA
jgi:hypothetical protein